MSKFQNDAIFWVDVDKIDPNPYQPRRDFNEEGLRDLAESIRQYGVLQPLTVTRNEKTKEDGGLKVYYELIAGERRLRAAKMANLSQVPVTIRDEKEDSEVKLELAIIENLQREDLNPIERAEAFDQLADEFDFTHKEIAEKIGKSREYVSNSMRLLKLPEDVKQAVMAGKISEGHTRPILMLRDKPEKQEQLFKEIIHKDLTVRESEKIARREAQDKVRKKKNKVDPQTKALEDELSDTFGTRVKIEKKDEGGQLVIDFFSQEDLEAIVEMVKSNGGAEMEDMMKKYINSMENGENTPEDTRGEGSTDESDADAQKEGEKVVSENSDTEHADAVEGQDETEPADKQANPDQSLEENEQTKGDNMAETLGTLIQQAKKEQAQQNESSDTTADTKGTQKQATGTQPKTRQDGDSGSSNPSNKQSQDKAVREDKAHSKRGQQPAPSAQSPAHDEQTEISLDSGGQKKTKQVANQESGDMKSNTSSDNDSQEESAGVTEKKVKNSPENPKESLPSDNSRKSTTKNSADTRTDQIQDSKESMAGRAENETDAGDDRDVSTGTETSQESADNSDEPDENTLQDEQEPDQSGQEEGSQEDDDDMYSVSNFSI